MRFQFVTEENLEKYHQDLTKRQVRRMEWLTVSKVTDKSRRKCEVTNSSKGCEFWEEQFHQQNERPNKQVETWERQIGAVKWNWMQKAISFSFSRILEMKLRFEIRQQWLRYSVNRDGSLRRGWTRVSYFPWEKLEASQDDMVYFQQQKARNEFLNFSVSGGMKLISFGGEAGGERNRSEESVKIWCRCSRFFCLRKSQ